MFKQKRAFLHEFCIHLEVTGGWPKKFELGLRDLGVSCGSGTLSEMKRGNPVAEKFCRDLIMMRNQPGQERLSEAIREFVRGRGIVDSDSANVGELLDAVCMPIGEERDWICEGIEYFLQMFLNLGRSPARVGRPCENIREVMDAIQWMYVDCGRLRMHNPMLQEKRAIAIIEAWSQLSLEENQRRAISWWNAEHSTVMLAMGDKRPIAMSVVFPLKESVWTDIRSGYRVSNSVTPRDFEVPSSYLIHGGLGHRWLDQGGEARGYTLATAITILRQYGKLSNASHPLSADLNLLSLAANDLARVRLKAFGYKAVGRKMHTLDVDMYERRVSRQRSLRSISDNCFILALESAREDECPSDTSDRMAG